MDKNTDDYMVSFDINVGIKWVCLMSALTQQFLKKFLKKVKWLKWTFIQINYIQPSRNISS